MNWGFFFAESTHWALNWHHLPNGNFPILFLPCFGETKRDKNSFSSYNLQEIDKIERYVRILLSTGVNRRPVNQSDIGIISPYKRQCSKLMLRFGDNHWNDIEVGTVETYQGREKPVIIISTVRSGGDNVGFLNNPKVGSFFLS
jgi:helicase MOV-10